jgi:hypothetical protein
MKDYKKQCIKFSVYKVFRMFTGITTSFILFMSIIAITNDLKLSYFISFFVSCIVLVFLSVTMIDNKIYTKDGIRIRKIK